MSIEWLIRDAWRALRTRLRPGRGCVRGLIALAALAVVSGCASVPERNPLPLELTNVAGIPGVPEARFWGDEWPKFGQDRLKAFTEADDRTKYAAIYQQYSAIYKRPHHYLAISGGGANGAFGAGLLVGWTAAGTRPEFTMVTGISTGALTAPFAFLGSAYDDKLKEVYTTISTKDVAAKRNWLAGLTGDSLADTAPLRAVIAKYITKQVVDAIGVEFQKGRRLFIGTANLDAGRSVIWNIGAIAVSDHPRKLGLIHDILRGSASIPIAFPPVMIPVEANGQSYDEMHVDGGTGSQVFVYPAAIDWRQIVKALEVPGTPQVYIIRNAFLDPDYRGVKRTLLPIASRSIDSLIRTQGIGDLFQIHSLCVRDGNDFNLAYIPSDFTEKPTEGFDPVYMGKLFERGHQMAKRGYPWQKTPPGFSASP
jgi:predicted acylesterase/phospholipase RssA